MATWLKVAPSASDIFLLEGLLCPADCSSYLSYCLVHWARVCGGVWASSILARILSYAQLHYLHLLAGRNCCHDWYRRPSGETLQVRRSLDPLLSQSQCRSVHGNRVWDSGVLFLWSQPLAQLWGGALQLLTRKALYLMLVRTHGYIPEHFHNISLLREQLCKVGFTVCQTLWCSRSLFTYVLLNCSWFYVWE